VKRLTLFDMVRRFADRARAFADRRVRPSLPFAALLLTLSAPVGSAQEVGWSIENAISGSLFFGNTRQTLITTRSSVGHADSAFELKGAVRFTYGESSDENDGAFVSKRSWIGTLNYDHRPFARYSTFLISTLETSLEKRIDFRYDVGIGEKLTFVRTETTQADVSLALLGERTYLPPTVPNETETLLRWSTRARYRRQMNERVRVSHETFYAPVANDFGRYTITSTTSIAIRLARYADLNLSFIDNYDSEAKARGARSYNDGQLVLGILTAF
jgi:hypothetical protein